MLSYDVFTQAFLDRVTEYDFPFDVYERTTQVDRYMKRAISHFSKVCHYDLVTTQDDNIREFNVDIEPEDLDEIIEIVSEGMVVQWLRPYVYRSEVLQNVLNTRDFTSYSPANLLAELKDAYQTAKQNFAYSIREYSYRHGDLTDLHL